MYSVTTLASLYTSRILTIWKIKIIDLLFASWFYTQGPYGFINISYPFNILANFLHTFSTAFIVSYIYFFVYRYIIHFPFSCLRYLLHLFLSHSTSNNATAPIIFSNICSLSSSVSVYKKNSSRSALPISLSSLAIVVYANLNT